MAEQQRVVKKLVELLQENQVLKDALHTSLQKAAWPGLGDLPAFYAYLNTILTHIPREKDLMPYFFGELHRG